MFRNPQTQTPLWPKAMRKRSQYYLWPHDASEIRRMKRELRAKIPLVTMLEQDWITIEKFQSDVFKRLYKDVKKFEKIIIYK